MPQQEISTTIAHPIERVDLDAVKLAAKKTIVPGATDTHGVQITGIGSNAAGTTVTVRVFT